MVCSPEDVLYSVLLCSTSPQPSPEGEGFSIETMVASNKIDVNGK
jgi:hypothetical protein